MGAAIDSVGPAVQTILGAPIIVAIAFLVILIGVPLSGLAGLIPLIGFVLSLAVGFGFLLAYAGIIGTAYAELHPATDGTFEAFKQAVSNKWKDVTVAYLILILIQFVYGFFVAAVLVAAVFVAGFGASATDPAAGGSSLLPAALGIGGAALVGIVVLAAMAIGLLVQFYDVAIVVGDYSGTDAFAESVRLFKQGPLSVLGYTVLRGLLGSGPMLLVVAVAIALAEVDQMMALGVTAILFVLLVPFGTALAYTYHTAYYTARRPETIGAPRSETGR